MFGVDGFDASWLGWLEGRRKACEQASLLVLLDGAFLPGLCARMQAAVPAHNGCAAVFEHLTGYSDEARNLTPFVVEFDPNNRSMLKLLEACDGFPMVSCIETDETAALWAERLSRWSVVDIGRSAFNFRHADTRRLPAIARTLRPAQKQSMLGPAKAWHYIDRRGRWQVLPLDEPGVGEATAAPVTPGTFDDVQFAALVRDSEADEMLSVLDARSGGAPASVRPSRRHALAETALLRADAEGVVATPDRLQRVENALRDMTSEANP